MSATYIETQHILRGMHGQVCGGEVGQRATESGKWVLTAQFSILFCYAFKMLPYNCGEKNQMGPYSMAFSYLRSPIFPRSINLILKPLESLSKESATDLAISKGEFLLLL